MTSKIGSILVLVVVVLVVLPAAAAGSEANVKMSASELSAACAAGGGHIAVSHSLLIKGGIATEDEVGIETLAARYRAELLRQGSVVRSFLFVGGWARKC